jgi:hypothetical protein
VYLVWRAAIALAAGNKKLRLWTVNWHFKTREILTPAAQQIKAQNGFI